jgi:hypothetical protein
MAAIAAPAEGRTLFDHHFKVVAETVRGHQIPDGFAFRDLLFNPFNLSNQVGHSQARCVGQRGGKSHCVGRFHFDGSIGGFGELLVRGNFGRGDHTLNVVDGSGDFSGRIAGKMVVKGIDRNTNLLKFDLTR